MTRKSPNDSPVSELLQTIDPSGMADESVRRTVEILLNIIEELNSQLKELREENQRLRDENNRLKGEQGQPEIKAKNNKGEQGNHSSETVSYPTRYLSTQIRLSTTYSCFRSSSDSFLSSAN